MKRVAITLTVILILLVGCASKETFETVSDVYAPLEHVPPRSISLSLPQYAVSTAISAEGTGTLYFCDGYTVSLQTLPAGDMNLTLQVLTGYDRDKLQVMETVAGEFGRYDFAWSCAGENGDQVCRGAVISDGIYHYAVTVMADAERAGEVNQSIKRLFASFSVGKEGLSTGS